MTRAFLLPSSLAFIRDLELADTFLLTPGVLATRLGRRRTLEFFGT